MSSAQRRRLLLGVLGLLLAVVGYRLVANWVASSGVEFGRSLRVDHRDVSQALALQVAELELHRLSQDSGEFEPGRNPWRFAPKAPPPPPPPPKVVERRLPPPRDPTPRNVEPPKPQPPDVDVRYLGSFGPERRKIAVFVDEDTIYNKVTGETLKEKFIVEQIGYESVDLKFVGFPDAPAERLAAGG